MLAVNRLQAQCKAYVRTALGFSTMLPEADRERIAADAATVVEAITKGSDVPGALHDVADLVRPFVLLTKEGTAPYQRSKAAVEKDLADLVRSLPVWDAWAKGVKGLSEIGVATYVGEAGDLITYPNPGKLWARLGLAPKGYYARTDADKKTYYAIPKLRRSRSWSITDILLRQPGPYQDLYRERRAYELANNPEFDKGVSKKTGKQVISKHGDLRARRVVEKRLVRDLWRAWYQAAGVVPPVPPHPEDRTSAA